MELAEVLEEKTRGCAWNIVTTTRCHSGPLPGGIIMFWRLGGQFVVVGGWLVQAQGTPQNSKNTFAYYMRMSY